MSLGTELRARWLNGLLAAALLAAMEAETLTSSHRRGAAVLNALIVAAMTLALAWRRRMPLAFAVLVMLLAGSLSAGLTSIHEISSGLWVIFIPAYSVAAYEARKRAVLGLVICLTGLWTVAILAGNVGDLIFFGGMSSAAWAAGRTMRAHRELGDQLERKAERLAAEREDRARLSVAEERTRIARELHAVVANSVSAMVSETQAASRLLDSDGGQADAAMAVIEENGREALTEMRRILGVLRHVEGRSQLAPQPGVGQIHLLIEQARQRGRPMALRVEGEAGPLPASIDFGLYRIIEDALSGADEDPRAELGVLLRFGDRDIELCVTTSGGVPPAWPTLVMRERVAICDGSIETQLDDAGARLLVRMPRAHEAAFA